MNTIGIICALECEKLEILKKISDVKVLKIYDMIFYSGKIGGNKTVLSVCGVGKIGATRTAQVLIDKFDVGMLINFGSAGALKDELDLADVVIARDCVQADADCTAFGTEKGKFQDYDELYINLDSNLIGKMQFAIEKALQNEEYHKIKIGRIATLDKFISDDFEKKELVTMFDADCVEMEGVAVAHVANSCNIPCVIVRGISDKHNDATPVETYQNYKRLASARCADFIDEFINILG